MTSCPAPYLSIRWKKNRGKKRNPAKECQLLSYLVMYRYEVANLKSFPVLSYKSDICLLQHETTWERRMSSKGISKLLIALATCFVARKLIQRTGLNSSNRRHCSFTLVPLGKSDNSSLPGLSSFFSIPSSRSLRASSSILDWVWAHDKWRCLPRPVVSSERPLYVESGICRSAVGCDLMPAG